MMLPEQEFDDDYDDDYLDPEDQEDAERDLGAQYPEWSGVMETRLKYDFLEGSF